MFIYLRLLLAHFIGDYPLQTGKVYNLKSKGLLGTMLHAGVITLCLGILLWPYISTPGVKTFIVVIGSLHLIQDWIKVSLLKNIDNVWIYLADQALHVLTSALVFLTPLKDLKPLNPNQGWGIALYNNNFLISYLIAVLVATYLVFYLLYYINRDFHLFQIGKSTLKEKAKPFTTFDKWFGMGERYFIVSLYMISPLFLLSLPLLFILRQPLLLDRETKGESTSTFTNLPHTFMSWGLAILTAFLLFQ